jgi:hypothetical protein
MGIINRFKWILKKFLYVLAVLAASSIIKILIELYKNGGKP